MRRVKMGTKIKVLTNSGYDTGTILFYEPSPYSKDVYLIKWGDGTETLYKVKKENVVKDVETAKEKTT